MTRQALLAAGTQLFAERGFKGATADLIARRAGVNKAMINYHFRGKRGLHDAILEDAFGHLIARLEPIRAAMHPAPERLRDFIRTFAAFAVARPGFPAMLLREVIAGGEQIPRRTFEHLVAVFGVVREIVEAGALEGSLRPLHPLLTHISLIGSLAFFFATAAFRERMIAVGALPIAPPAPEDYVRHIEDLMTRGLSAAPESA